MRPAKQGYAFWRFFQERNLRNTRSLALRWLSNFDNDQPRSNDRASDRQSKESRKAHNRHRRTENLRSIDPTTDKLKEESREKKGPPKSSTLAGFFDELQKANMIKDHKGRRILENKAKRTSHSRRENERKSAIDVSFGREVKDDYDIVSFFDRIDTIADRKSERQARGIAAPMSDNMHGSRWDKGSSSDGDRKPGSLSETVGSRPILDMFPVKRKRSLNAYDEVSFDRYDEVILEKVMPNKKFLRKHTKQHITGERAQAVINWLRSDEPSIDCDLPLITKAMQVGSAAGLTAEEVADSSKIFQDQLREQRQRFLDHLGWDEIQYESAGSALLFLANICAQTADPTPLEVAWKKLKEAGFPMRQDLLHNYLYVMSMFSTSQTVMAQPLEPGHHRNVNAVGSILDFLSDAPRKKNGGDDGKQSNAGPSRVPTTPPTSAVDTIILDDDSRAKDVDLEHIGEDISLEVALCHDFLYDTSEQSLTVRIRKLVSMGQARMAEQLLDDFPDNNVKLRTYAPVFNSYLAQDDVSSAMKIYYKMRNARGVTLQPENCIQLMACVAENGFFSPNSSPIEDIDNVGFPIAYGPALFDQLAQELADVTVEISSASARRLYNALAVGYRDGNDDNGLDPLHILEPLKACTDCATSKELIVSRVALDADTGVCPRSGAQLRLVKLDSAQKKQLEDGLLKLAKTSYEEFHKKKGKSDVAVDSLKKFGEWLNNRDGEPYTAIIDGANVAFYMQNFDYGKFNYHQIKFVVDSLEKMNENVLVILPYKYTRSRFHTAGITSASRKAQTMTKEERLILQELDQSGKLFVVPGGCLDDYYWMYASVSGQHSSSNGLSLDVLPGNEGGRWPGARPMLVSNDRMRDHKLSLLEPRLFRRWYSNFMVNYTFSAFVNDQCFDKEIGFRTADFYSREIQGNPTFDADGTERGTAWHFPVSDWDENESFCVRIPR